MPVPAPDTATWWQQGIVYQIYPRSFQDTNGDGVGDLAGIVRRLDHVAALGADAVWISPIYPSPMKDFGYDVADYCGVDPLFGSLADFDALVAAARERGLKVLLDFVPSHTSDEHPWFRESRASRDSAKRDWYVWADPKPDGGPPNNWLSEFGGSAWSFDETTGQYWLHIYLREQPALNWRNPDVRAAMLDVMRFWFDRGVDGFRVDAVEHLVPAVALTDNPPDPDWRPGMQEARALHRAFTAHQPEVFDAARAMRAVAKEYAPERLLIGEAYGTLPEVMAYYGGEGLDGFQLPFNFQLIFAEWRADAIARMVDGYEAALPPGAWPNWVLGNHDRPRIAGRVGAAQARVAAMLLLTLRGTPTIYQGDELGMVDVPIPPEMVQDPMEKNAPGQGFGRDPVRTPIPWDESRNAGFTTGTPWLPIGGAPPASVQAMDDASMLALHRRLIALRRAEPALALGSYRTLSVEDDVIVFERVHGDRRLVVALNFANTPRPLAIAGEVLLSTHDGAHETGMLAANEGRILVG
ncbi:alpha-amylase family glycosyl hydrolase [Salinarimonas ramus]|uniref:Alpha-amylase n=1 Tax=Salinarimonas ramus TaxID=690164 RepID=A0A917Q3N7_9HYPH|nr:alpha-amylase family glycosyl hydrolase [Salinarimonas ramus]GGK19342.1 alpha-amylase [Salinarimonas ramus]